MVAPACPSAAPAHRQQPRTSYRSKQTALAGCADHYIATAQIALWEEYSCKLEQRVHALTHENDALQRQIAGVQETLAAAGESSAPIWSSCMPVMLSAPVQLDCHLGGAPAVGPPHCARDASAIAARTG
jgi:hypothetical protein